MQVQEQPAGTTYVHMNQQGCMYVSVRLYLCVRTGVFVA